MSRPARSGNILRPVLALAVFAALGSGGVALVKELSAERIARNESQALHHRLAQIVPPHLHDNVLGNDWIEVVDDLLGGTAAQPIYRARRSGRPVASVVQASTARGYNGTIELLVGIGMNGDVLAVRILRHRETPGLGDAIEVDKGDWITRFDGASLAAPARAWAVRRDGGEFDQLTGATVTSRAVLGAVHGALLYYARHGEELFADGSSGARAKQRQPRGEQAP